MAATKKYKRFLEHIFPSFSDIPINLKIKSIYGAQIGQLVFSPADFIDKEDSVGMSLEELLDVNGDDIQDTENGSDDFGEKVYENFLSAIKNSPHIFGLPENSFPKVNNYSSNYFRYSFEFDEPIAFTIKVPKSKKKFEFEDDAIEQFDVITKGSQYIAFVELDDCPRRVLIGQEFREQMRELLNSPNNIFRLGQVGPTPLHPEIYVIDVANPEYIQREITFHDGDLYIISNFALSKCSQKDIYEDVLNMTSFDLDSFYTLSICRSLLIDLNRAIHQKLQETVNTYMQLGSNIFFINFGKLAKLRQDLLMIHKGSLELELLLNNYESLQKSFFSSIDNNIFLDDLKEYFTDVSEPDCSVGNVLFKTLEYMEKSISSLDVAIRTIFAAIIGASIGVFVTLLLKL